jgi:hypothetical protein
VNASGRCLQMVGNISLVDKMIKKFIWLGCRLIVIGMVGGFGDDRSLVIRGAGAVMAMNTDKILKFGRHSSISYLKPSTIDTVECMSSSEHSYPWSRVRLMPQQRVVTYAGKNRAITITGVRFFSQ